MIPGLERRRLGHDVRLDDVGGGPGPGTGRGRRSHGARRGRRRRTPARRLAPQPATRRAARSPPRPVRAPWSSTRIRNGRSWSNEHYDTRASRARRTRPDPVRRRGRMVRAPSVNAPPAGSHDTRRPPATRGPPGRDRRRGDHRRVDPPPVGRLGTAAIEPRGRSASRRARGRCRGGGDRVARRPRSRRTRSPARRPTGSSCRSTTSGPGRSAAGSPAMPFAPRARSTRRSGRSRWRAPRCSRSAPARRRPPTTPGATCPADPPTSFGPGASSAGRATPVALSVHRDEPLPGVATLYNLTGTPPRPATGVAAWPAGEFVRRGGAGRAAGRPGGRARLGTDGPDPDTGAPSGWFVGLVVRGPG